MHEAALRGSAARKLAIVGGGPAATAILVRLNRDERLHDVELHIYDRNGDFGAGAGFSDPSSAAIVNRHHRDLSIYDEHPRDFTRWIASAGTRMGANMGQGSPFERGGYPLRFVYGQYLRERFGEECAVRWRKVVLHRDAVVDTQIEDDGVAVLTEYSEQKFAYVVLASGGGGTEDFYGLYGTPNYVHSPYPLNRALERVSPEQRVGVIGTSLSAVDVIRYLWVRDHIGQIALFSRGGLLPGVRQQDWTGELAVLTRERVQEYSRNTLSFRELNRLIALEMRAQGWTAGFHNYWSIKDPHQRLRFALQESIRGETWMSGIAKMSRKLGELAWEALTNEARRLFDERWFRKFATLRAPMPLESARILDYLFSEGQLTLHGRIQKVQHIGSSFSIEAEDEEHLFDSVLNTARGRGMPASTGKSASIAQRLLDRGDALSSHAGGIRVSSQTAQVLNADGLPRANLFAVGEVTSGSLFYTSAVDHLKERANIIVDCIANLGEQN